jgi:hypothetical protein
VWVFRDLVTLSSSRCVVVNMTGKSLFLPRRPALILSTGRGNIDLRRISFGEKWLPPVTIEDGDNRASGSVVSGLPRYASWRALRLLLPQTIPQIIKPSAIIMIMMSHQLMVRDTVNVPLSPATSTSYDP